MLKENPFLATVDLAFFTSELIDLNSELALYCLLPTPHQVGIHE